MKCPKCDYVGFDESERCRNCGYEFSLVRDAAPEADLAIRKDRERIGPLDDFALRRDAGASAAAAAVDLNGPPSRAGLTPDLPLFTDDGPIQRRAAVTARPARPPLGVRRPTPDAARLRGRPSSRREPPPLVEVEAPPVESPQPEVTPPPMRSPAPQRPVAAMPPPSPPPDAPHAPPANRLLAGTIDLALLLGIDASVVYFTLRLLGLGFEQADILPMLPLGAFLFLLNAGYAAAFTAASGQTIGKMATGIRVVGEQGTRVPVNQAMFRTLAYVASLLPAGVGFAMALFGRDRLALHDRLAHTRVVRA